MWGVSLCAEASEVIAHLKPHLSHREQIDRLVDRGLTIQDRDEAVQILKRFGYYRLSGYFYPLRKTKPRGDLGRLDEFVEGASLELVVALAEFDKSLRVHVMHAIETIEVAVRVSIAHTLGPLAPDAHLQPQFLDGKFTKPKSGQYLSDHEIWVKKYRDLCERSRDDFVKHHKEKYGGHMPIWVGIELWDFGLLSKLFQGMSLRDQIKISKAYGGLDGRILSSWLRNISFVRNVVAHHGRLWNRTSTALIVLPSKDKVPLLAHLHQGQESRGKLYESLVCMQYLLKTIQPGSLWRKYLAVELSKFPKSNLISLDSAGFPKDWMQQNIWQ